MHSASRPINVNFPGLQSRRVKFHGLMHMLIARFKKYIYTCQHDILCGKPDAFSESGMFTENHVASK